MCRVERWLQATAEEVPDRVAVADADGALTFSELAREADAVAAMRGWRPGDAVPVAARSNVAFAVELHAILRAGAVAIPVDPRLGDDEQAVVRSAATAIPDGGDGGAIVVHTSGTTSRPRPVVLPRACWEASARASRDALGLGEDETWLCTLPLSHVGGLSILTRGAILGWTAVLRPRFEAAEVAALLAAGAASVVSVVPTMLARLLDAGLADPPGLRCMLVGGGPVAPALMERALAAGLPVAQTYGMTETCSQATTERPGEGSPTAGRPLPGTELRITRDGEILLSGPTVAPAAPAADGWLRTGDLGRLDAEGRLVVTGRVADTIVTGGENVAPAEVEGVLLAHPAVAEAAVLGRPDAEWGERVVALVVPRDGVALDPDAVRAFARERLAGFKVPKAIEPVDALPRNATGKLLRRELR